MKILARLDENGRMLHADNDEDWAVAHPTGQRAPALFCPDCRVRLSAVQMPKDPSPGQPVTRWFRFKDEAVRCEHRKVLKGVRVQTPSGESDEHAWFKEYTLKAALCGGYTGARLEHVLPSGLRADVYVPGVVAGSRVEVQRGLTDVAARTGDPNEGVWLLRGEANKRAMWSHPCVQVRLYPMDPSAGARVPMPWELGAPDYRVMATSTVFRARARPGDELFDFFEPCKVELSDFLTEVWRGRRVWRPGGTIHKYGGWVRLADLERHAAWRADRQRRRIATEQRNRARLAANALAHEARLRERQRHAEEEARVLAERVGEEDALTLLENQRRCREELAERLLNTDNPTRQPLPPPAPDPPRRSIWRVLTGFMT